ncbi:hypothetical protein A2Z67_02490 [Candidatus Woesebacteria bacterium RBG_13_36_22]|uniref:Uncharacterized protein n=1 Tax=Candidatus Woesebacteria bacterium RBG_13_36_22 TaxID=1802478 RepID=A0A1F7X1R5_9BACT|nr:MAG: hypothetical protein A2Z67_02490 [Candidatus Woesebacteria bacterium RBG_13_36_22]
MADFDKLLEPPIKDQRVIEDQQEYRYVGSLKMKKGTSLYYYDPDIEECDVVKTMDTATIGFDGEAFLRKRAQWSDKYYYTVAINKKNALRKILKFIKSRGKT